MGPYQPTVIRLALYVPLVETPRQNEARSQKPQLRNENRKYMGLVGILFLARSQKDCF